MILLIIMFFFTPGIILLFSSVRIVKQYEKGIVLTLGKYSSTRNPGLTLIIPAVQKMTKVDIRLATVDIPRQEVITKDNVTINVDAVVYFRVAGVEQAILEVQNFRLATAQFAQAALRDIVGQEDLDTLLSDRSRISEQIKLIVDEATEPWGIDVENVNIQNVELPGDMKRVMSKQAEAEREKRSVITKAEGELEASDNLARAAKKLGTAPGALHLRTLATLNDLSSDQSNTVIFAIPLEVLRAFESVSGSGSLEQLGKAVSSVRKNPQIKK